LRGRQVVELPIFFVIGNRIKIYILDGVLDVDKGVAFEIRAEPNSSNILPLAFLPLVFTRLPRDAPRAQINVLKLKGDHFRLASLHEGLLEAPQVPNRLVAVGGRLEVELGNFRAVDLAGVRQGNGDLVGVAGRPSWLRRAKRSEIVRIFNEARAKRVKRVKRI